MPILGSGGRVLFKRPLPPTVDLPPEDYLPSCSAYNFNSAGWISGDLACINGLPIADEGGGFPSNVAGYASYQGSTLFLGPNRTQISNNNDVFYKDDTEDYPDGAFGDDANFYAVNGVGGVPEDQLDKEECYWIGIDQFGKLRFYESRCAAIAGCPDNAVTLSQSPPFDPLTLRPAGTGEYANARWDCIFDECLVSNASYGFSDVQDEDTDVSICTSAPEYDFPVAGFDEYENADVQPRPASETSFPQALCNIREYTLNLDAPAIDTTLVGEKFGENIKSLVNGGGSFEFFIDRACFGRDQEEASWLMLNLLFLTEGGASGGEIGTEAWFYLYENEGCNSNSCFPPLGGSLYYKANILITQTAINVRPDQIIAGTAEFVTTGEIKLLQAP